MGNNPVRDVIATVAEKARSTELEVALRAEEPLIRRDPVESARLAALEVVEQSRIAALFVLDRAREQAIGVVETAKDVALTLIQEARTHAVKEAARMAVHDVLHDTNGKKLIQTIAGEAAKKAVEDRLRAGLSDG